MKSAPFYKRRLSELMHFLFLVKPEVWRKHFSLEWWAYLTKDGEAPRSLKDLCYAADPIGLAIMGLKSFRRERLKLVDRVPGGHRPTTYAHVVFRDKHYDWDAVCAFFGLEEFEANFLFCPRSYRSRHPRPVTVARRIFRFLDWLEPFKIEDHFRFGDGGALLPSFKRRVRRVARLSRRAHSQTLAEEMILVFAAQVTESIRLCKAQQGW